jgi:hypothetical protein
LGSVFSCKSPPSVGAVSDEAAETFAAEQGDSQERPGPGQDVPEIFLPGESGAKEEPELDVPPQSPEGEIPEEDPDFLTRAAEPSLNLAEIALPPPVMEQDPPENTGISPQAAPETLERNRLPDPLPPALQKEPLTQALPPAAASPPPQAEQALPPSRPVIPEVPPSRETPPPPLLRPPEREAPRQPSPLPGNSLPEAPALPPGDEEKIVFSRTVRLTAGQLLEIPFRGAGWVYLGELGSRRGIVYDSRRLDPEGQTFVFRAEAAGTYTLKFYRQDFIRDYILNDYVQVIVGEAPENSGLGWFKPPEDRGRVVAEPRWPAIESGLYSRSAGTGETASPETANVPPVQGVQSPGREDPAAAPLPLPGPGGLPERPIPPEGTAPGVSPEASAAPSPLSLEDPDPQEYVRRAQMEYDAGRVGGALSVLDELKARFPVLSDEALWLYGQLLEASSPARDIRRALDCYRRLIQEYPQSPRVSDARRRITYLERYYLNIR